MIFANTFPKSGTGLIRQLLSPFGGTRHFGMYNGETGHKVSHDRLCSTIRQMMTEPVGTCTMHLHWRPSFGNLLREEKVIFLIRDPRDIVVSHAHYIETTPAHHLHSLYEKKYIEDYDENIHRSMRGVPEATYEFPDIANRFLLYFGWMYEDNVLVVRFEDLVEDQENEVMRIVNYLDFPEKKYETITDRMIAAVNPEKSTTFRKGKPRAWTESFSMPNHYYWKANFNWLLKVMGYEEE